MFAVGILTSVMVATAWGVNIVTKPLATLFGGTVTGLGLLTSLAIRRDLPVKALNRLPAVARRAALVRRQVIEEVLEREPILNLADALAVKTLLPSTTIAALRGRNPRLIHEAIRRAKAQDGVALYVIAITEWPGLFSGEQIRPDPEIIAAFNEAAEIATAYDITVVPIWSISGNAAATLAEAAVSLGVDAVMVGVSQRTAIYHMLRGNVVRNLTTILPENIRIITVG
jgi:nucleotide-binding universal stress UspA family protein